MFIASVKNGFTFGLQALKRSQAPRLVSWLVTQAALTWAATSLFKTGLESCEYENLYPIEKQKSLRGRLLPASEATPIAVGIYGALVVLFSTRLLTRLPSRTFPLHLSLTVGLFYADIMVYTRAWPTTDALEKDGGRVVRYPGGYLPFERAWKEPGFILLCTYFVARYSEMLYRGLKSPNSLPFGPQFGALRTVYTRLKAAS